MRFSFSLRPSASSAVRASIIALLAGWVLVCGVLSAAAQAQSGRLPFEPPHDSGQGVTGAYEGWFKNPDGSVSLLFGYFNRNFKEVLDIPIGPNNRIEPGGPDQGQPTHFLPRRQWGVFTIPAPANLGDTKLTWTLVANGQTTAVPINMDPLWEIAPYGEASVDNTPPVLRLEERGPTAHGPRAISTSRTTTVRSPLTLTVWVADDAKTFPGAKLPPGPPITVTWSKFRGPGVVTFANPSPPVEKADFPGATPAAASGRATMTATFSEPGEYVLRVVANDWSGDGGRGAQCCWTNGQVKVSVQPETAGGR